VLILLQAVSIVFDKKDLMFSSVEHEKANERIDKTFGNYLYIARHRPSKKAEWSLTLGRWLVSWEYEATEEQMKRYGMKYIGRSKL